MTCPNSENQEIQKIVKEVLAALKDNGTLTTVYKCKNCRYYKPDDEFDVGWCPQLETWMDSESFCSEGKPKRGESYEIF